MPPPSPPLFGKADTVLGGWRGGHPRTPRAHAELRQEFLGGAGGAVSGRRTEGRAAGTVSKHNKHTEGGGGGWRGEPVPRRWQLSLRRGLSPPGARALARPSAFPAPPGALQGPPRSPQPRAGIPPGRAALPRAGSGGYPLRVPGVRGRAALGERPRRPPPGKRRCRVGCAPRGLFLSRMELAMA